MIPHGSFGSAVTQRQLVPAEISGTAQDLWSSRKVVWHPQGRRPHWMGRNRPLLFLTATAVPGGSLGTSPQPHHCLSAQSLETYLVVCCCIFALKPSPARMTDALGKRGENWNPATASNGRAQNEASDPQPPRELCYIF